MRSRLDPRERLEVVEQHLSGARLRGLAQRREFERRVSKARAKYTKLWLMAYACERGSWAHREAVAEGLAALIWLDPPKLLNHLHELYDGSYLSRREVEVFCDCLCELAFITSISEPGSHSTLSPGLKNCPMRPAELLSVGRKVLKNAEVKFIDVWRRPEQVAQEFPTACEIASTMAKYLGRGSYETYIALFEGSMGCGKSTIAYYSVVGALMLLGLGPREAHEVAKAVFFNWPDEAQEFIELVRRREPRAWVPAIVLDEVGAVYHAYYVKMGKEDVRKVQEFARLLATSKEWFGAILMTYVEAEAVAKAIRRLCRGLWTAELFSKPLYSVSLWHYKTVGYKVSGEATTATVKKVEEVRHAFAHIPTVVRLPDDVFEEIMEFKARISEVEEEVKKEVEEEEVLAP